MYIVSIGKCRNLDTAYVRPGQGAGRHTSGAKLLSISVHAIRPQTNDSKLHKMHKFMTVVWAETRDRADMTSIRYRALFHIHFRLADTVVEPRYLACIFTCMWLCLHAILTDKLCPCIVRQLPMLHIHTSSTDSGYRTIRLSSGQEMYG